MFKVYYTDPVDNKAYSWDEKSLSGALSASELFRKRKMSFVTIVSENPNCVSLSGVDAVKEGCTPDGVPYTWRKRR